MSYPSTSLPHCQSHSTRHFYFFLTYLHSHYQRHILICKLSLTLFFSHTPLQSFIFLFSRLSVNLSFHTYPLHNFSFSFYSLQTNISLFISLYSTISFYFEFESSEYCCYCDKVQSNKKTLMCQRCIDVEN